MPSNNSKYSPEMREQTARFIIEGGRPAIAVAEEMGIDANTVCCWVRDFRRANSSSMVPKSVPKVRWHKNDYSCLELW